MKNVYQELDVMFPPKKGFTFKGQFIEYKYKNTNMGMMLDHDAVKEYADKVLASRTYSDFELYCAVLHAYFGEYLAKQVADGLIKAITMDYYCPAEVKEEVSAWEWSI